VSSCDMSVLAIMCCPRAFRVVFLLDASTTTAHRRRCFVAQLANRRIVKIRHRHFSSYANATLSSLRKVPEWPPSCSTAAAINLPTQNADDGYKSIKSHLQLFAKTHTKFFPICRLTFLAHPIMHLSTCHPKVCQVASGVSAQYRSTS